VVEEAVMALVLWLAERAVRHVPEPVGADV
jgi:hypothetical protein